LLKNAFDTVIVRLGGEIGIKAPWTRKHYERRLASNIKATLKHYKISYSTLIRKSGRLYIKTRQAEDTAEKLRHIFGVSSLSPATETSSNLNDVLNESLALAKSGFAHGKSFAVRCHRVGKHEYTSQNLCAQVGKLILTSLPELELRVDLKHPEQSLQVEVRDKNAYLFTKTIKGVGGLPLGTQPKLVCLLKSDMQSATACWMTMKRGCPPILVHVENSILRRHKGISDVKRAAQVLMEWNTGFPRKLRVARYRYDLTSIPKEYTRELAELVRKRLMLRTAQRIAEIENAEGIVTGDWIPRRAAHTIHFFRIQDEAVKGFPVYRPLIGLNEAETEAIRDTIGLSKTAKEELVRTESEVTVKLAEIKKAESRLSLDEVVEDSVKSLYTLKL